MDALFEAGGLFALVSLATWVVAVAFLVTGTLYFVAAREALPVRETCARCGRGFRSAEAEFCGKCGVPRPKSAA
jgi:ribosomal protein L37E